LKFYVYKDNFRLRHAHFFKIMADGFNSLIDKVNSGLNEFSQTVQTLASTLKEEEFESENVNLFKI
jgi:hypothetical protein